MCNATSTCPGPPCRRCSREPPVGDRIHPQPLITAIPALVQMSKKVMEDSISLVLDPWNWRARLLGTSPARADEDSSSQSMRTHKVYQSNPEKPPTRLELDPEPELTYRDPRPVSTPAKEGKRGKKTVHFVEPELKKKRHPGVSHLKPPAERARLELYEAVSPADDPPRVIDVQFDTKTNRWCMDESAAFPVREDPVAMICSKSVLRALTGGTGRAGDSAAHNSRCKPHFQIHRIPEYAMIKIPDGGLATLKASSHDLFHIRNLENFLLHTHQDPRHAISASGGEYMKHWLIELPQLVALLANPKTRPSCKSAFWELVHRGLAEKVTLQLWHADGPQPADIVDIETLDYFSWFSAYEEKIPKALRQQLDLALDFFHSRVPGSPWPAVIHPNISIMSHKGITSGTTAKTSVAEAMGSAEVVPLLPLRFDGPVPPEPLGSTNPNSASTLLELCSVPKVDGEFTKGLASVEGAKPPRRTQHLVHVPSPCPYQRPLSPTLPPTIVARLSAGVPWNSEPIPRHSHVSNHSRSGELLTPELRLQRIHKLSCIESLDSETSITPSRPSSPTFRSDVSSVSSNSTATDVPSGREGASITHGKALAEVDYGKETGGLIDPSEGALNSSQIPGFEKACEAADIERESRMRAMKIWENSMKSWKIAATRCGKTDDNITLPNANVDAAKIDYPEFSYQLDEALDAEQQITQSGMSTPQDLEEGREEWVREQERLSNASQTKRELRDMLAKKWAQSEQLSKRPCGEVMKTTYTVNDALQYFFPENPLTQIECLLDDNGNVTKKEFEQCKQQLDMANQAVTQSGHRLHFVNEKVTRTKDDQEQKKGELKGKSEELVQLRNSRDAHAKKAQSPADVSCTADRSKVLVEDVSQCRGLNGKDEAGSIPVQSTEAMTGLVPEDPMQLTRISDGDDRGYQRLPTRQQPDVGTDGAIGGICSKSSSPNRQSSLRSNTRSALDPHLAQKMSNIFKNPVLCALPSSIDSDEDANSEARKDADGVTSHSGRGDERVTNLADGHASETMNLAHGNHSPRLVTEDLPNGVVANRIILHRAATGPEALVSETLAESSEDVPHGPLTAGASEYPEDLSVLDSGSSLDPEQLPHGASIASPEDLNDTSVAGSEDLLIGTRDHGPSSPGKKKGATRATRKKSTPVKRNGKHR